VTDIELKYGLKQREFVKLNSSHWILKRKYNQAKKKI